MIPVEHHVKIGQIKLGRPGDVLKTVLGSCVGIAIVWRRRQLYALAHCLLPQDDGRVLNSGGRYVNLAVPRMLELLGATAADATELEAIVCGGGQMFDVPATTQKFVVGPENLRLAKQTLERFRIRIAALEEGGAHSTKMRLCCATGDFEISRLPAPPLAG